MKKFIKIFTALIILVVFGICCTGFIVDYRFKNLDLKTEILRNFPSKMISFETAKSVDYKLFPYPQIVAKGLESTHDLAIVNLTIDEAKFTPNLVSLIFNNDLQTEKLELENVLFSKNDAQTEKAFKLESLLSDIFSINMMPKLKEITFKNIFLNLEFDSLKFDRTKIINEAVFDFTRKRIFLNSTNKLIEIFYGNEIIDQSLPKDVYYTFEINFLNLELHELGKLFITAANNNLYELTNDRKQNHQRILDSLRNKILISTTIYSKGFSTKTDEKIYEDESKFVFSKYKEGFKIDINSNILKLLDKKNLIQSQFDIILNIVSDTLDANFKAKIKDSNFDGSLKMSNLGPNGPEYIKFKVNNKNINLAELAKLVKQSLERVQISIPLDIEPSGIIKELDVDFEVNPSENINHYKVTLNAENILVTPFGINKVYTHVQDVILDMAKNNKGLDKSRIVYKLNSNLYDIIELLSDDNSNIGSNIVLKAEFDSQNMKEQLIINIENSILKINFDIKSGEFTAISNNKDSEFYKSFGEIPIIFKIHSNGYIEIINSSDIADKILAK